MPKVYHVQGEKSPCHAFLATPSYPGPVSPAYLRSMLQSGKALQEAGITWDHYLLAEHCHVDDARNFIVRDFLMSSCDTLVFLDADVGWEPADLVRLIQHDRDLVAGVYPKRGDGQPFPVRVAPGTELRADAAGLVEVQGAPTGFMKIRRHVLEKMVEANKDRQYRWEGFREDQPAYTLIFERTYGNGVRMSGDYAFCQKWRDLGGKVYVDPFMNFLHSGTKEYSGCLAEYWKREHGVHEQQLEAILTREIEAIKGGTVNPDAFVDMVKAWDNPFSIQAELAFVCADLALKAKGPILETGSGLSTLLFAAAAEKTGNHVYCLEHDPVWAEKTRYWLDRFGLAGYVRFIYAPLRDLEGGRWYDLGPFDLPGIALALCDGPPRKKGDRKLLYRVLGENIRDAIVLMDDAIDPPQLQALKDWSGTQGRKVEVLGEGRRFAISIKEKP